MLPSALWLLCLVAVGARAQDESSTSSGDSTGSSSTSSRTSSSSSSSTSDDGSDGFTSLSFTNSWSTITGDIPTSAFTGSEYTYLSPSGQSTVQTLTTTVSMNGTLATITSTSTSTQNSQITATTKSVSLTEIGGISSNSTASSTRNGTASSTSSAARPSNTLPCNGFPEFCNRKYSNITQVVAHNSAFVVKNNAASNQLLPIRDQLNDGVRMLQGEVHYVNKTLWNCHTSCDLLNAGTWQSELEIAKDWLDANPYDVLSFLIVNSDLTKVENFVPAITNAGLLPYVYEPQYVPQYRDQWPTLGEMILKGQRMVIFMDYNADQSKVPYILDEFTHMWETPFSPTNQSFPCTQERPPNLSEDDARDRYMYLANQNLNTRVDLSSIGLGTGSTEILIPNTAELNVTNGLDNQYGRAGATLANCTADWGRPPTFLLVDYYNFGMPKAGSIFRVAAEANGVTYTLDCCGKVQSVAPMVRASFVGLAVALFATAFLAWR